MDSPIFEAKKQGLDLHFPRDPHPDATAYLVVDGHGLLVLFPNDRPMQAPSEITTDMPEDPPSEMLAPDRDAHLRRAFAALTGRVVSSEWTSSTTPYADLEGCLRSLVGQQLVAQDVRAYLAVNPAVAHSAEMLFTSMAMSARAEWRAVPEPHRGVAARGWFLGRWLPTFLVLDGPILRFLNSTAFRQQAQPSPLLRAVRRFFKTPDFMLLRHAFAHWSFRWEVVEDDSIIVGTDDGNGKSVRVPRAEADAFHIVTFALIEAIDDVFLRPRRHGTSQADDP